MGVAVLEGPELIYYGVATLAGGPSPQVRLREARRVVLRMVRDFHPSVLAVEKAFFSKNRNAALLNVFVDEFRALGQRGKLQVLTFAPNTVKKAVTGNGRATKTQVAQVIVSKYPELKAYLIYERKWKQRFHCNRFDAVAVGLTARAPRKPKKASEGSVGSLPTAPEADPPK